MSQKIPYDRPILRFWTVHFRSSLILVFWDVEFYTLSFLRTVQLNPS